MTTHTIFVADQNFTVQDTVIFQNVVKHLLIQILRGSLECDFHTSCSLRLEVDVWRVLVQSNAHGIQFSLEKCSLLSSLGRVENHHDHVTCLGLSVESFQFLEGERNTNLRSRDDLPTAALSF